MVSYSQEPPTEALVELVRLIANGDGAGCFLFDEHGQEAFAGAEQWTARQQSGLLTPNSGGPRATTASSTVASQCAPPGPRSRRVDGYAVRWRPTLDELLNGSTPDQPEPGPPT